MEQNNQNDNKSKVLIFGKYQIIKKIGEGSFGKIYLGFNKNKMEYVAIKLEPKSNALKFLKSEAIYLFMLKSIGIPKLKAFGQNRKYNILVETLLGKSLSDLLKIYNNRLPLKDTLMIAIQVIERLEYIHSKFLIHRDIKPENFLIGYEDPYIIYLIDFGLCKKYRSNRTGKHIQFSVTKRCNGTPMFASLNSLKGYQVSRRDDLECVAYMIIYLMKGLPWDSIRAKTKYERFKRILKMKIYYKPEILCKDLPTEIKDFFSYCRNLNFEQEPNYDYICSLFNNALAKNGFINDLLFSWIKDPNIKYKLKNDKNINNKIRNTKRKASPQIRILHSIRNSYDQRKPSNTALENSELINFTLDSQIIQNKRNFINYPLTNNSLVDTFTRDESLNINERIKTPNKFEYHKKYRKLIAEQISRININRNINFSNNTNFSGIRNNTFQEKININKENIEPIFKLDEKCENRKVIQRIKLKKNDFENNKKEQKVRKVSNHSSINSFSNEMQIKTFNNNYSKKIPKLSKTKTNLIAKNIKKLMVNKNKSNIINIINNNNINSNINMLIKIQPKCKIQRKNTDIYINNETSDNNNNLVDTIIDKKLKKLKYSPVFTKINLSPIKNLNELTKEKHYSNITDDIFNRNVLNQKIIKLNSVNDEILKHNKLKLQKVKFMKVTIEKNTNQNKYYYNNKTLSKSLFDNLINLKNNTPEKTLYNNIINYNYTSNTLYENNKNTNLNNNNIQNKFNQFKNYTYNVPKTKKIIKLDNKIPRSKKSNISELNRKNIYSNINNFTNIKELSNINNIINQITRTCLTSNNSKKHIRKINVFSRCVIK